MKKIKIGIIDDEFDARRIIKKYIERYVENYEIVGEADGVKSGIEFINEFKPELIFLDINMTDGTGFNLLEELDFHVPKVIFTTAYDEFAIKAFKYKALDYLLKPIDPEEFKDSMKRLVNSTPDEELEHKEKLLFHEESHVHNKIAIPSNEGTMFIDKENIVYFKADSSYCSLHLNSNKQIVVSKPLKYFADKLEIEQIFLRPHKSYLVNSSYIEQIKNDNGGELILKNGDPIPIARSKKNEICDFLKNLF